MTLDRSIARAALALLAAAGTASAQQESAIFSLSGPATAPFGSLADTELARIDLAGGLCRPWFSAASSAFFAGDVTGDGITDEWRDVDALWVGQQGGRVTDVCVSFNTTFGPWLDGDIVRLAADGTLQLAFAEATIVGWFGLTDGQIDVDGLHFAADGSVLISFADNEASALLSTDTPGVVTDGSVVVWNPASQSASVRVTEAGVDALVTHALGSAATTTDTLGVALDRNGVLVFSVQSPTSHDASLFRDANGGEVALAEAALGLAGGPEIDALDLLDPAAEFLAARMASRFVAGGQQAVMEVDGAAHHIFVVTLSLARFDAALFPADGFQGLLLDPTDPLFAASLADLGWTYATTDAAGHVSVLFEPAPPGVIVTVMVQAYDLDGHAFGAPLAIELTG
jgi:hypothetical protein